MVYRLKGWLMRTAADWLVPLVSWMLPGTYVTPPPAEALSVSDVSAAAGAQRQRVVVQGLKLFKVEGRLFLSYFREV